MRALVFIRGGCCLAPGVVEQVTAGTGIRGFPAAASGSCEHQEATAGNTTMTRISLEFATRSGQHVLRWLAASAWLHHSHKATDSLMRLVTR